MRHITEMSMKFKALMLLLVAAVIATSCSRRPLEEEEEWSLGNYADILLLTDWNQLEENPTGMTVICYPEDGGTPQVIQTNNVTRNVLRLRRTTYKILIFNQSTMEFGSMTFSGLEGFETAAARLTSPTTSNLTTTDFSWLASVISDKDSLNMAVRSPEPFNAHRQAYEVTEALVRAQYNKEHGLAGVDTFDPQYEDGFRGYVDTIYATPTPVAPTMNITAHVKGINNAYKCRAYIVNLARENRYGLHTNNDECCIHPLTQWTFDHPVANKTLGTVNTKFRCFGIPEQHLQNHDLFLRWDGNSEQVKMPNFGFDYLTQSKETVYPAKEAREHVKLVFQFFLRDGKTYCYFAFDVTDRITYVADKLWLNLEIPVGDNGDYPIVLPDVPDVIGDGDPGFDADVEDWEREHIDVVWK